MSSIIVIWVVSSCLMYAGLFAWIYAGLRKAVLFAGDGQPPVTRFSIIIPFRNEERHLPALLRSIRLLAYPHDRFEVLFIDDDSSDSSCELIEYFIKNNKKIHGAIIPNRRRSPSAKKDALISGIERASYGRILVTDADVILPSDWLALYDAYIRKYNPVMLLGNVDYQPGQSYIEHMQFWDWSGMQCLALSAFGFGKPVLGSAANMSFDKEAFYRVHAYEGNTNHAGGDDIFLMMKMHKAFPGKVQYMLAKDVPVTYPEKNWRSLFRQRIRWAEKTGDVGNALLNITVIPVVFIQFTYIFFVLAGFWDYQLWLPAMVIWGVKSLIDYTVISKYFRKRSKKLPIGYYTLFVMNFIYPFMTAGVVSGVLFGRKLLWKGREIRYRP